MDFEHRLEAFRRTHRYRRATAGGAEFSYLDCGEGAQTVVLLTGGLGVSELFFPYIEALEGECRVLTFDYPEQCRTLDELCDAVAALLDVRGIERAVFAGSSFGGYVAQTMARRHPGKMAGLALFSTAGLTQSTLEGLRARHGRLKVMYAALKVVPYAWLKPLFMKASLAHLTDATPDERALVEAAVRFAFADYTREKDLHMTGLLLDIVNQRPCSPEEFAFLAGRVLLILPEGDDSFTAAMQRELVQTMPDPLVVSMDAGHLATFLRVDAYVEALRGFLDERVGDGGIERADTPCFAETLHRFRESGGAGVSGFSPSVPR